VLSNKHFIYYSATGCIISKNKEFLLSPDCAPNSELHNCCIVTGDATHSTVLGLAMKELPLIQHLTELDEVASGSEPPL
jgi:hypothetical protein